MVLEKPLTRRAQVLKNLLTEVGFVSTRISANSCTSNSCTAQGDSALHLLIMTQFFPPDFAATGQLIEELVTQLAQQGVNVRVFTGQPGYAFAKESAPAVERTGNVWVKRSRMAQLFSNRIRGKAVNGLLYALRSILHLVRRSRHYNILLVTTAPPFLPVIGYLANVLFGLPYVCLLYDLYPDIAVELDIIASNHPITRLWQWLNRQVWRRADGIIVLSDSMKARIVEQCPAVKEKISVIHSWSNARQIVPIAKKDNWFAQEHGLTDDFVVLYSGNMGRCHDTDTLFEVAQLLRDDPIVFACIGGGAKRDPLMARVKMAGLNNFRFLPYQQKAVLPYSLTAGDLSLVSVAQGMESLVAPSKLYPAMATGRPIGAICPKGSYLGELLAAAGCGAAFENGKAQQLADYIRALSRNRALSERLGESGRQYLDGHFTPEIISGQYLKVIQQAAG
jgi:glycosyltransferase involved in cell wall biosynthesis